MSLRIVESTAGDGTSITIKLDTEIPIALTDSNGITCYPSPYRKLSQTNGTAGFECAMGVAIVNASETATNWHLTLTGVGNPIVPPISTVYTGGLWEITFTAPLIVLCIWIISFISFVSFFSSEIISELRLTAASIPSNLLSQFFI